jgi:hypothetical protein
MIASFDDWVQVSGCPLFPKCSECGVQEALFAEHPAHLAGLRTGIGQGKYPELIGFRISVPKTALAGNHFRVRRTLRPERSIRFLIGRLSQIGH